MHRGALFYVTATDHVDVFGLNASSFIGPIEPPPNGPPLDVGLRGNSLTPDSSQVIIADFGAQSVYLVDPDGAEHNDQSFPSAASPDFPPPAPHALAGALLLQAEAAGHVAYLAYNTASPLVLRRYRRQPSRQRLRDRHQGHDRRKIRVDYTDMNTLVLTTPCLPSGRQ
jgi:hypothetical protein